MSIREAIDRIPPRTPPSGKYALAPPAASISVNYNGFSLEVQAAFQRAVDIWSSLLRGFQNPAFQSPDRRSYSMALPLGVAVLTVGRKAPAVSPSISWADRTRHTQVAAPRAEHTPANGPRSPMTCGKSTGGQK